jgi:hypothetical protein
MVEVHLGLHLPVLGCLLSDDRLAESSRQRRPLLAMPSVDQNVRTFHQIAEHLMSDEMAMSPACDLVQPTSSAFADGTLPAPLEMYMRRHPRHSVNWMATLMTDGGPMPVRVIDVSVAGAALEILPGVAVGQRATLVLDQLPGPPVVEVVVQNIKPTLSRAGVAFVTDSDVPALLVAAARSPNT